VFSHVFEKYWDYLPRLDQHSDFGNESGLTKQHMRIFSAELSSMNLDAFEPLPAAEAKQTDIEISDEPAVSRLRPIQDGLGSWQEHRSSAATGSGGPAPGLASPMFDPI
jgi:hypothetical protein